VSDNLPQGITWAVNPAVAGCSIDTTAPPPDVLTCNLGTIANGQSVTITLTGTSNSGVCPST
jgi:hypothetical protein